MIFTATARISDWTAVRHWYQNTLADLAATLGATRCQIYRDMHEGAQMLIVLELPDPAAVWAVTAALDAGSHPLLRGTRVDDRSWEPVGWTDC